MMAFSGSFGSSSPNARPANVSYCPAAPNVAPSKAGETFVSTTIRVICALAVEAHNSSAAGTHTCGRIAMFPPFARGAPRRDAAASSGCCFKFCGFRMSVPVCVGHTESRDRLTLEIELNHHDGLLADNPAVVAWLDRDNLGRLVFDDAAVRVFDVNLSAREKPTCACMQRSVPVTGFMSLAQ